MQASNPFSVTIFWGVTVEEGLNEAMNRARAYARSPIFATSPCLVCWLLGCAKILLNYRDQTQWCNSMLDLF